MGTRFLVGLVVVAGCGAELSGPGGGSTPDSAIPSLIADAAIDSPSPDARPCMGGAAHVQAPGGSCFILMTGPKPRADAEADCVALGGHLASVTSAADSAAVTTLVAATPAAFLGATDLATEGTYLWPDGTPLTFTNWRTGEPNNGNGQYQEDCLVVVGTLGGGWDDRPCAPPPAGSGSYAYVCSY